MEIKKTKKSLKCLSLQTNPKIDQTEQNKLQIEKLLQPYKNTPLDIIVLPEMCLTGYDLGSPKKKNPDKLLNSSQN